MADFRDQDLTGSRFDHVDLTNAQFDRVDLSGAVMRNATLGGTTLREVRMDKVVMRGVELIDVDIDGYIGNLVVNGVDVKPLILAELDRLYPERLTLRPTDPAGFRAAWVVVEQLWAATVDRVRSLDPALLHESVDGEWSFIETLRHLAFATDVWLRRAILGDPAPWHPLGLPWDGMPETPGVPRDREVRPSLDTVLELRRDRMAGVREYIDALTDEALASYTEPVPGPGWPQPRSYPVHQCLLVILEEEWEHHRFAERDLAVLTGDRAGS